MRITLALASANVIGMGDPIGSTDGTFKTRGYPPGAYSLRLQIPAASGWTLKSITIGGRNYVSRPFDLSDADVTGVVVTYTDRVAEISGSVTGVPVGEDAAVMLFSSDDLVALQSGLTPTTAKSGPVTNGTYRLTSVVAGDYYIFAVTRTTMQATALDPAKLAAIVRQGTRITLGDKEKRSMALTVLTGRRP
jgi:hypothetical protein